MNTTVAFAAQATAILMGFFTRVIFTRMLSEGYVGINGLFNDILNILSLSELGKGRSPGRCGGSSGVPLRPSEGGAYKKLRKSKAPALP